MKAFANIVGDRYGWLIDKKDVWDRMSAMLVGVSWQYAKFAQRDSTSVPEVPGIYFLVINGGACVECLQSIKLKNVMYIGKTDNLRRRFKEHLRDSEPNPSIRALRRLSSSLSFWFGRIELEQQTEVERWLIWYFLPAANQKIEIPFVVNIPGWEFDGQNSSTNVCWRGRVRSGGHTAYYNYSPGENKK